MHRGGRIGGRMSKMAAAIECNSSRGVGVPHHSPAKIKKAAAVSNLRIQLLPLIAAVLIPL